MALVTVLTPYNNTELYEYMPLDIFSSRKKGNQNNAKEPFEDRPPRTLRMGIAIIRDRAAFKES